MITLTELLWAVIGLLLTIGGNFLKASIVSPPWYWGQGTTQFLGVNCQIGAVLVVGCLGGKNSAAIAQIAYLLLGLSGFQFFAMGGGWQYIYEPSFGYLLGFVPGAWLCGYLAFRSTARLEWLTLSSLAGLAVVHLVGMSYLALGFAFKWIKIINGGGLMETLQAYSGQLLPGQIAMACAAAVLAYLLRRIMIY